MKVKHSLLASAVSAAILSASAPAFAAPSAKFAATYSDSPALASAVIIEDATVDTVVDVTTTGHTLATIKVPSQKELLVGLSAEIGLLTDTSVKGKNGGTAKAIAGAEAYVHIYAVPVGQYDPTATPSKQAVPGKVILSSRVQELSATLGGVIQSCTDGDTNYDGEADVEPDGTIDVASECIVTDEEIGLLQDTTAAHHFNFVLKDMVSGEYDIVAVFTTGANAEIDICASLAECDLYDPEGTVSGSAEAMAVVNKTMLTVQEVRAVKGGVNGSTIDIDSQECTVDGSPDSDCDGQADPA